MKVNLESGWRVITPRVCRDIHRNSVFSFAPALSKLLS
jgi:hypothetical protein